MKTDKAIAFPEQDEIGPEMKGADALVASLEREGVDVVYAYPGGASMELHQALTKSEKIRTILPRFEQGGGFMAHGHARVTGKASVCMATSGPGATNLVTCIADAFMDSIPLIAITGQVYQQFIGKTAFQETDFFGMTRPIVKHSFLVLDKEDLLVVSVARTYWFLIKHEAFASTRRIIDASQNVFMTPQNSLTDDQEVPLHKNLIGVIVSRTRNANALVLFHILHQSVHSKVLEDVGGKRRYHIA